MESGFGADFSRVRVHDGDAGNRLSADLHARAFTVGEHVAFAAGQYRPGTILGDALIAHELAHVHQQADAKPDAPPNGASDRSLERAANQSMVGMLATLWTGARGSIGEWTQLAGPRMRSGLRIQRCEEKPKGADAAAAKAAAAKMPKAPDAGRAESKEKQLNVTVTEVLNDARLDPADFEKLGKRVGELGLDQGDLRSLLSFDHDFSDADPGLIALIVTSPNPSIRQLAKSYGTAVGSDRRKLETDPLLLLLQQVLTDSTITMEELDAVRSMTLETNVDRLKTAVAGLSFDEATRTGIMGLLDLNYTQFAALLKEPGLLPLSFSKLKGGGLTSRSDLRVTLIKSVTAAGVWRKADLQTIRNVLEPSSVAAAKALLQTGGLTDSSAALLTPEFKSPNGWFAREDQPQLLSLTFQKTDQGWELDEVSKRALKLPRIATAAKPFVGAGGGRSDLTGSMSLSKPHTFPSGLARDAEEITVAFRGHTLTVLSASELLVQDNNVFDRVDAALDVLPVEHLELIKKLILDPGNDPKGKAGAWASPDGTVNMYFSNAGAHVAQSSLNRTTVHEVGHLVAFEAERTLPGFWDRWHEAQRKEAVGASRYAYKSDQEDFAEAYLIYLSGGRTDVEIRKRFPHRFALMDTIFGKSR